MVRIEGRFATDGAGAIAVERGLAPSRVARIAMGALVAALLSALVLATHPLASTSHPARAGAYPRPSSMAVLAPVALAAAASASIGASEHEFWTTRHGAALTAQGGGIHSTFTATGADLRTARGTLDLSLLGAHGRPLGAVVPTGVANEASYRYGSVRAFYENGPYGLEQGFTVAKPQNASSKLVLVLGVGGSLTPRQSGARILFQSSVGVTALSYGQLGAVDATGRRLPAHMSLAGGSLQLHIATRGARYPVRIDPFVQQGEKLTGGAEEIAEGKWEPAFGYKVALSADGNTALVSAPYDANLHGGVWVFTRSGETWSQQGPKLTDSEAIYEWPSGILFGNSLALSADGNTALIGGRSDHQQKGAVWVFTRSGGKWTQQGPKLTGGEAVNDSMFGESVALSAEGNTALIGGTGDGEYSAGAAWVFTRSGSAWTQQGPKLTGAGEVPSEKWNGGQFGGSVALSADGDTALIGGAGDNAWTGAAWVFTRAGETWTQQGEKLTASGESGEGELGDGLALSADGNTALIGAPGDSGQAGAAFAFTRSGETWTQQGEKLTDGKIGEGWFGIGLALSGDGNTAIIGAPMSHGLTGTAWVFKRSGEVWIQPGEEITASGIAEGQRFGFSAALSTDGETALVGGLGTTAPDGAAWAFEDPPGEEPPIVKGISVKKGPASGGTAVTITGARLDRASAVDFGSVAATSYEVNSPNSLTAITPEAAPGKVAVTVSNADGTGAIYKKAFFTFKKVKKPPKVKKPKA
jgi:IPT/TIG domain